MEHCAANWTASLSDASERLIEKLILDPALVGSERSVKLALLIDKFKDLHPTFTLYIYKVFEHLKMLWIFFVALTIMTLVSTGEIKKHFIYI